MAATSEFTEWRIGIGEPVGRVEGRKRFWLEHTYPTYGRNAEWWRFLDQAYMGGQRWADGGHLARFLLELAQGQETVAPDREESPQYAHRKAQAWRMNLVAEWVDSHVAFLSSQAPERPNLGKLDQPIQDFAKGVDFGRLLPLDQFSLQVALQLFYRGTVYVGTDLPVTLEEIQARLRAGGLEPLSTAEGGVQLDQAKARELGLLPYSWVIHPADVLNGRRDAAGNFLEILYREDVDGGRSLRPPDDEDATTDGPLNSLTTQFRYISTDAWATYRIQEESGGRTLIRTAEGPNLLGIVPIRQEVFKPSDDPWCGLAAVEDWALVDRMLFNTGNALTHHLKEGAASQRWLKVKGLPPVTDTEAREEAEETAIGAASSGLLLMGPEDDAGVLNMSFENAGLMLEALQVIPDAWNQWTGFRDRQRVNVAQSGTALARAFRELNARLRRVSRILERMETFQFRVAIALVQGTRKLGTLPEGVAQWPENYDVRAVEDSLAIIRETKDVASQEVLNALVVDVLTKALADKPKDELDALIKAQLAHKPEPEPTPEQLMDDMALEAAGIPRQGEDAAGGAEGGERATRQPPGPGRPPTPPAGGEE